MRGGGRRVSAQLRRIDLFACTRTNHSKTTSDCCTAETFCPTVTWTASPPTTARNFSRKLFALSSRLTHAMKPEGSDGSSSAMLVGVAVPGVWDSHLGWPEVWPCRGLRESRLARTPDIIAMPIVPHPTGGAFVIVIVISNRY